MSSTHLSILESSAALYPTRPAFRVPSINPSTSAVHEWNAITYAQFKSDVDAYARYWYSRLSTSKIPQQSVIGLWIGGFTYFDVLHVYGLSRAGYVPQMFSLRLPNPDIIFELLHRANAKALIFDASYKDNLGSATLPTYPFINAVDPSFTEGPLPVLAEYAPDDVAFVFHTSGSTSGSPKLVPCTYRWLHASINKSCQLSEPRTPSRPDVTTWMGSMCHIGQSFMLLGSLYHGSCTVQPTVISFSSEELMDMIARCGVNRLRQFAAFLAMKIRAAQKDRQLHSALANLDEVMYSGMPLPRGEEDWAYANQIPLRNLFGSTECGATLINMGGCGREARLLRSLRGTSYKFVPIHTGEDAEAGYQSNARMLEFVILSESEDCPHISLRSSDGHFHTGDLFQEVSPGYYLSCGRDDDWIKSENSLRCDTKAIEDNVRDTCSSLISDCIVVGTGRPSPVLFVESSGQTDDAKLKKEIIRKTRPFHSRRYLHERISSPNFIVVVPRQTLPRTATKGNIRRKAVETQFQAELDQIYGLMR